MSFGTKLYTWLRGNYVGKDKLGNVYYTDNKDIKSNKGKRWVLFSGEVEASNIPPHWHAWLHRMTDDPPVNYQHIYDWQKDHKSNATGTSGAYYPSSHPLSNSSKKFRPKSEYESWKPE